MDEILHVKTLGVTTTTDERVIFADQPYLKEDHATKLLELFMQKKKGVSDALDDSNTLYRPNEVDKPSGRSELL